MDKSTEQIELTPAIPYPTKSRCAKLLKQVFGARTRYMNAGPGKIVVVEYVDGKHERHLVEVEASEPAGWSMLYWAAFTASMRVIGYEVERVAKDGKLVRLDLKPIFKVKSEGELPTAAEVVAAIGEHAVTQCKDGVCGACTYCKAMQDFRDAEGVECGDS